MNTDIIIERSANKKGCYFTAFHSVTSYMHISYAFPHADTPSESFII